MRFSKLVATSFAVAALAAPAASLAQEPKPGEFTIPGTSTTLKLNGFVEFDAIYDFSGADEDIRGSDWASFLEFQPLDGGEQNEYRLYTTARTSRVGLTTSTPTGWGDLGVRVEADFNAPSPFNYSTEATTNGNVFRLRHAYGELGGLLIGQTWTNFADLGSYPDTVDFNPHGALALTRQPMVRYAFGVGKGSLAVALENPQVVTSNAGYPQSATVGRYYDRFPDFTANFTMPFGSGHLNLRAVALEYAAQPATAGGTPVPGSDTERTWGYGVGVSGSLKFARETLVWSVQGGDGIGRYMFQTTFQGAALTAGGDIETWKALGYHVGLTHAWSPSLRSNLIWTQTFIEDDADLNAAGVFGSPALVNKRIDALNVNSFISPFKNAEFGLEYMWGQRIIPSSVAAALGDAGNDTGTQHRVNALARYTFY